MKIFGKTISLADTRQKPVPNQEVGTAKHHASFSLFDGEVIRIGEKISIPDLIKMRQNDGTAQALYNIIRLPILSNPWTIEADDEDINQEQANFVKDCLSLPPHMGGMSTPFNLVLSDMLRAPLEGFRLFEKVHDIQDGKIVFRKLATRENTTVSLLQDGRGGFNGAKQSAFINDKFSDVIIPKEKCFLFTFGKEMDSLYGESAFKAAYYHYDKKHRLYYLANQAVQQFAIPPKVGTLTEGTSGDPDAVAAALDSLAVNASVGLPAGWDAKTLSSTGKIDPLPLIDHHNAEMARSILAQFMMLGTGSSTGSWALSSDQSDMFILALQGVMAQIEDHINSYLIPELHYYNYAVPKYSKFKFQDFTDQTRAQLSAAFTKIMEKGEIPDWVRDGIVDKAAADLEIIKPEDADNNDSSGGGGTGSGGNSEGNQFSQKKKKHIHLADAKWARPLTPAEKKVNFAGIQKKYDTLEADFTKATKPVFDSVRADVVKKLDKLLQAKDYKALDGFEIPYAAEYRKIIVDQMLDAYTYAKTGAADEINRKAPANKTQTKDMLKQQAQSIVDQQFTDILVEVKRAVAEAMRKNQLSTNLSIGDVLQSVGAYISGYFLDKVGYTASASTSIAVNAGRDDVFQSYKTSITRYQFSAILDEVTCDTCADLDGTVVDEADYQSTDWMPPIHFNCRCLWVAILDDELDQPDLTGFPENPGGDSEPDFGAETPKVKTQPLKNFKDDNLETIAQADIAGRPNAEINTQIEKLLKSEDPAAIRDAIRLSIKLPKDDIAAMLDSITLPDKSSVGSYFYGVKLGSDGKIKKVLKDAALDPRTMTVEQIAKKVGLPTK
jgi:SPP1 gp7 family putative phage head morphogenesis protein